jgi:hypothetical protein
LTNAPDSRFIAAFINVLCSDKFSMILLGPDKLATRY